MRAAAECTPKCGKAEAHYGSQTRPRRREHPFAYRQYASLLGMYEPIQTAYSTAHDTIQDRHGRKLSKDRKQRDCDLLRETVAATSALRWHGDEELRLTRRRCRRHFERGDLQHTMKKQRKVVTLCFGILVCWWSSFTGSTTAAVAATVPVNFGGGCPSACSGHGYCTNPRTETCSCHQGWAGGDCSIRKWCGTPII